MEELVSFDYIIQFCRVQSVECRVQSVECRVQSVECRVQNVECRVYMRSTSTKKYSCTHYLCRGYLTKIIFKIKILNLSLTGPGLEFHLSSCLYYEVSLLLYVCPQKRLGACLSNCLCVQLCVCVYTGLKDPGEGFRNSIEKHTNYALTHTHTRAQTHVRNLARTCERRKENCICRLRASPVILRKTNK